MKHTYHKAIAFFLAAVLAVSVLSYGGAASAAGSIYVNDGSGVLGTDIGSAYAVGGDGSVSVVGDSYAITGDGTVKVGQNLPGGEDDGTTVKVSSNVARIGLYYYYNNSRDSSLAAANLQNDVGYGYKFGYYDSDRVFHELASTNQTKITMKPTGGGREISVYITGTDTVIFRHTNSSYNLAVRPVSTGGKAKTWFKGYSYYGDFEYYRYIDSRMTVINVVNIEDYVKGVVPYEMSSSWPIEALKAQAVCARTYYARTYYARSAGNYSQYGFDVTADNYCQVYFGTARASANSDAAVDQTAGKYVTYNGNLCTTFYFSSDGGATEDCENIFYAALPYCRGVVDTYEQDVPQSMNKYKEWTRQYSAAELSAKLNKYGITNLSSITPEYSRMGNVIKLTFTDVNGNKATVSKDSCYSVIGLPSIRYRVEKTSDNTFVFNGSGWGHNIGMSQWGAYSMASYHGCSYQQIIKFYFTGVNISTGV